MTYLIGTGKETRANYLAIERARRKMGIEYQSPEHNAMIEDSKAEAKRIVADAPAPPPRLWFAYERFSQVEKRFIVVAFHGQFDSSIEGVSNPDEGKTGKEIWFSAVDAEKLAGLFNEEWTAAKATGKGAQYDNILKKFLL